MNLNKLIFFSVFFLIFCFNAGEHDIPYQLSFYGVLTFLLLFLFTLIKKRKIYLTSLPLIDLLFVLCIFLSLLFGLIINIQGVNSKAQFFLIIYIIISYFISSYILRFRLVNDVERSFIYVSVFSFFFGLILLYNTHIDLLIVSLRQEYALRSNSFYSISTTYGIYLSIAVILSLKQFFITKNKSYIVFLLLFFAGIASTGSRTGISALLFCSMFFILLYIIRNIITGNKNLFYIVIILSASIVTILFIYHNLSNDFISRHILLDRFINGDTNSLGGRTEKIERGIKIFFSGDVYHNLFGFGSDGFAYILKNEYSMSPHSGFIRIFNDFGFVFAFAFLSYSIFIIFTSTMKYLQTGNIIILYDLSLFIFIIVCESMVNSLFVLSFETILLIYSLLNCRNVVKKNV